MNDYYDILKVKKTADAETIKRAYRRLSLQKHPDKNNGDENEFKKINEAYQTLGDPRKRQIYDINKNNPFMHSEQVENVFNAIFSGGLQNFSPIAGFASMTGFDPMNGFNPMMGGDFKREGNHFFSKSSPWGRIEKPAPIIKTIEISLKQAYTGTQFPLEIERWVGSGAEKTLEIEKIYIRIYEGVDDDEIIIIKNKGNIINEKCKGDIKLIIKIKNISQFQRDGINLIYKKQISLKEALTGFNFNITAINGKRYTINNSKARVINPGFRKSVPNLGMKRDNITGNLIIIFDIRFPEILTADQIKKIKEIL